MRDDVMMDLIQRTTEDDDFRRRLSKDLEGTLQAEGYSLTDDELAAAREFHKQIGKMDDEAVNKRLKEMQASGMT